MSQIKPHLLNLQQRVLKQPGRVGPADPSVRPAKLQHSAAGICVGERAVECLSDRWFMWRKSNWQLIPTGCSSARSSPLSVCTTSRSGLVLDLLGLPSNLLCSSAQTPICAASSAVVGVRRPSRYVRPQKCLSHDPLHDGG